MTYNLRQTIDKCFEKLGKLDDDLMVYAKQQLFIEKKCYVCDFQDIFVQ